MTIAIARRRSRTDGAYVLPLVQAVEVGEAGEKANNLSRLARAGHPVPEGFVVSNRALDAFLEESSLMPRIERTLASIDPRSVEAVRAASGAIARLVIESPLPAAIAADLDLAIAHLLPHPVIVRSSAIGEDSTDASFAGQLDSIADLTTAAGVRQALLQVWASRWSARSIVYQLTRGKSLAGMGAIVQRQVASAISGVLFTESPGRSTEMTIEYCSGAGDALVSGRVNPGRLSIVREDFRWSKQAALEEPSSAEARFVNDVQVRSLARRALEIERAFSRPQDIEWTMAGDGRVWIVQARPITARPSSDRFKAYVGEATRQIAWSNANVNENFPEPISPLLYSIARTGYYHYFRNLGRAFGFSRRRLAAMEEPLRQIIGVQGARMYYNLTSIHGVLRSAPLGDLLASWFNQFTGAEDTTAPAIVKRRRTLSKAAEYCELALIVVRAIWQYAFVTRRVEQFERTVDAFAARTHPAQLKDRPRRALLDDLRAFRDIRNNRWKNASLADTAAMVCYGGLKRSLGRAFPSADQAALHNSLLKALPNLPSGMPAVKLWELSRLVRSDTRLLDLLGHQSSAEALAAIRREPQFAPFAAALDRFLEDWGFRRSGELMLTVPSFQEEPEALLDIIKAYVGMEEGSPEDHLRSQRRERLAETERVAAVLRTRSLVRGLPFLHKWHVVAVQLRWTQQSILLRERARLKQALLYNRLRRIVLALGERLVEDGRFDRAEDIFFLTADEIDDVVTGSAMFPHHLRELVAMRRAAQRDLGASKPPDSLTIPDGEYWHAESGLPQAAGHQTAEGPAEAGRYETEMNGLGVCGGSATARAAVLDDVSDAHRLKPGDVLITRQTDPGWGAVFPLISGLVMERGGMLSHGAIIAREFGIPSVVGVANATRAIPHGGRVHVDGDRGTVRVLSEVENG
jgi:pyruvate,water dikinase